jgi:Na+-driven multidrug efflux pump
VASAVLARVGKDSLAAHQIAFQLLAAAFGVFVPVALLSLALDWGIVGVWAGLVGLIGVRLVTCAWRFSSRRWALVGAPRR